MKQSGTHTAMFRVNVLGMKMLIYIKRMDNIMSKKILEKVALVKAVEQAYVDLEYRLSSAKANYDYAVEHGYTDESIECAKRDIEAWDKVVKALEGLI